MPELVSASSVPETFNEMISKRQSDESIGLISMSMDFSNNPIIDNLLNVGLPGDYVAVDNYGHRYAHTPKLTIHGFVASHIHNPNEFSDVFAGNYFILNTQRIRIPPLDALYRRSHIKAYAVGERILSLGGVNCTPYGFYSSIDGLVQFGSEQFRSFMDNFVKHKGNIRSNSPGLKIVLDDSNVIIIDSGVRGVSPILDSVYHDLEDKEQVTSVSLSSNYIPFGKMNETLTRLQRRGADIEVFANSPSKFWSPYHSYFSIGAHVCAKLFSTVEWRDPSSSKFNHFKAIIITYRSGNKVAYVGSHNFNTASVRAGTSEVTLRTVDDNFIEQLESFFNSNLRNQD